MTTTKNASERDIHITNLVNNFKLAIVEASDIPDETHIEDDAELHLGPVLLETTGRKIMKRTNYFSFVLGKQQFTAPATIVERLRRVETDFVDGTHNLVISDVHIVDTFPVLATADDLNDEMYHWGHQVHMVPHSDHEGYNMMIHVSRFNDDTWGVRTYLAQVAMP